MSGLILRSVMTSWPFAGEGANRGRFGWLTFHCRLLRRTVHSGLPRIGTGSAKGLQLIRKPTYRDGKSESCATLPASFLKNFGFCTPVTADR